MDDLAGQVLSLKDELERAYREVDRLEETVAELRHSLEEARRGARGSGGGDGNGEDGRDNGANEAHHSEYKGRIAELHQHIALLEEDNRVLREAPAAWEAGEWSQEEHELLTPAEKAQRRQAIQLLSERIRMLMGLLRSSLDQGDASRSAAEEMNARLNVAEARVEELEGALQAGERDRAPSEDRTDAMRERVEDVSDVTGMDSCAEEQKAEMNRERGSVENSSPESEQRREQLVGDFTGEENEDNIGSQGDNEGSGQADTGLAEGSGVSNKSPGESASTEDDAAWNCVRSSVETQSENGLRQQQRQRDSTWLMLLDLDPRTESSAVIPIAIEEEEEKEEFPSVDKRQARHRVEGAARSAEATIDHTESSGARVRVDRFEAESAEREDSSAARARIDRLPAETIAAIVHAESSDAGVRVDRLEAETAGREDSSAARARIDRLSAETIAAARHAEAAADRAESSAGNARVHRFAAQTAAAAAANVAVETVRAIRVAQSHGSYCEEQAQLRQPPLAPQSAADARLTTSSSAIPHAESSRASVDPLHASLGPLTTSIDRDERGAATKLSGRASLTAKFGNLAADAAAVRERTVFPPASSHVRSDRRGDIDQIEQVIAAASSSRNARQRGSGYAPEASRQRPATEAAAATTAMPSTISQCSKRSPRDRTAPSASNVHPTASVGRARADSRAAGASAGVKKGRSLSWRPPGRPFVNPYATDSMHPTARQSAQAPSSVRVSWMAPDKSNMGRDQTGRDTRDSRKVRPRTRRSSTASGSTPTAHRGENSPDGVVPGAASDRPKKLKKKSRATRRVPVDQAKACGHKGTSHAHDGPCSRSCACPTCPCSGEQPSLPSASQLRRQFISSSSR